MKYKLFELQLRDKFKNATEPVDVHALINQIHPVQNTIIKTRYFWLLLSISSLVLIAVSSYYYTKPNSQINKSFLPSNIDNPQKNKQKQIIAINSISKEKNKSIRQNTMESDNKTVLLNKKSTKILSKTKNQILNSSSSLIFENNKSFPKKSIEKNTKQYSDLIKTEDNSLITFSNLSAKENLKRNQIINISPILKNKLYLFNKEKSYFINDPITCPSFSNRTKWHFTLIAEFGLLYPIKQLKNDGNLPEVFNIRKANEKPLEGIQTAIYTQINRAENPLYFKFGASYTKITDRLKYNYTYTEIDTTQGIISITESENGDTLTVIIGDIIKEITIERNLVQHQFFHLIDIPFGIGYNFDLGTLSLGIEAGGQFNILLKSKGKILEGINTINDIDNSGLFKSNLGISYYGNISIIKSITFNQSVYLSARFRYLPNSFSSTSNSIKQKYNLAGIHLGYMYTFE